VATPRPALVRLHRWLGVPLCLLFLVWFPTGIVMMYCGFPEVTDADRVAHLPALDASAIHVLPLDAAAAAGIAAPRDLRLATFDGRPIYRVRSATADAVVYADTGERRTGVARAAIARAAVAWTGRRIDSARVERLDDVDQWTVALPFDALRPLWKFSWPDGEEIYVSQASGEVVQETTTRSRRGAWLGPIPHWLYFTPLRRHNARWRAVVMSTSGAATLAAILGLTIGIPIFSPRRRYRIASAPARLPYRGRKRQHVIAGIAFGVVAATWAFSGLLSMDPWTGRGPERPRALDDLARALRGDLPLDRFAARPPAAALRALAGFRVHELELAAIGGDAAYVATLDGGETRVVALDGTPSREVDRDRLTRAATSAAAANGGATISLLTAYDRYYQDRRGHLPLPILLVDIHDAERSRGYVDPATARVAGTYSSRQWSERWLYHGLHSLELPWIYRRRPLWDIVVIVCMAGGTALAATATSLAWAVVRRRRRRAAPARGPGTR